MSSRVTQRARIKVPIKTIAEKDQESHPNTDIDVDDVGTLHLDHGEGLFDYSPLKLASLRQVNQVGKATPHTAFSGPISSNPDTTEFDDREMDTIQEIQEWSPSLSRTLETSKNFLNNHAKFNRKNL